jgi:hypothetical protein
MKILLETLWLCLLMKFTAVIKEYLYNIVNFILFFLGLRFVDPYFYVYRCYVKKRWIGLPLLRLCSEEFKGETKDYYVISVDYHLLRDNFLINLVVSDQLGKNFNKWKEK